MGALLWGVEIPDRLDVAFGGGVAIGRRCGAVIPDRLHVLVIANKHGNLVIQPLIEVEHRLFRVVFAGHQFCHRAAQFGQNLVDLVG